MREMRILNGPLTVCLLPEIHPQSSGAWDESLVVHNGIITNYEGLKETLVRHGFIFELETDTEVIPKLAKLMFDQGRDREGMVTFSQVVAEVMKHLEGAYALIFKSPHYPNELIACKRGSTLILGVENGNISILKFEHGQGKPALVRRASSFLDMEVEQIKKGKYDHYMQKEIYEQPHSLITAMRGRLKDNNVVLEWAQESPEKYSAQ